MIELKREMHWEENENENEEENDPIVFNEIDTSSPIEFINNLF